MVMYVFGIDTSDPVKFPKDPRGFVAGFNNPWESHQDKCPLYWTLHSEVVIETRSAG